MMPIDIFAGPGLATLTMAMLGAAPAGEHTRPIALVSEPAAEGVKLKVVGSSDRPLDAAYALEVSSETRAGTNRSVQRGNVRLQPGLPVTLVSLKLGNVSGGAWTAKLTVTPSGGDEYEVVSGSGGDR